MPQGARWGENTANPWHETVCPTPSRERTQAVSIVARGPAFPVPTTHAHAPTPGRQFVPVGLPAALQTPYLPQSLMPAQLTSCWSRHLLCKLQLLLPRQPQTGRRSRAGRLGGPADPRVPSPRGRTEELIEWGRQQQTVPGKRLPRRPQFFPMCSSLPTMPSLPKPHVY